MIEHNYTVTIKEVVTRYVHVRAGSMMEAESKAEIREFTDGGDISRMIFAVEEVRYDGPVKESE